MQASIQSLQSALDARPNKEDEWVRKVAAELAANYADDLKGDTGDAGSSPSIADLQQALIPDLKLVD